MFSGSSFLRFPFVGSKLLEDREHATLVSMQLTQGLSSRPIHFVLLSWQRLHALPFPLLRGRSVGTIMYGE